MTDDWCPPTDERESPRMPEAIPTATAPSDDLDPVLGISEGDIRMVDAFYHELAVDASEAERPRTADEEAAELRLAGSFEQLKTMTRDELLAIRQQRLQERRRAEEE
ncbi:MAG: hypothetical protein H6709_02240 [Kofleriaceae bacterium]|nr:hypothetical protein [Myxococcales bacterium]MCB9570891.1 hypothetical protein [Kofleriaceae bacterium]